MSSLTIGDRQIGADLPVLIVAEIGVNHDGSVDRAIELVDISAACGADAIKLQIFRARALMHPSSRLARYQAEGGASDPVDMLSRYELSDASLAKVVAHARRRSLLAIATPFSLSDLELVRKLDLAAIKIASPDLVNRLLLDRAAALGMPLLISTGAATLDEVDETFAWLRQQSASFAFLHCISSYPAPDREAHIGWISELAARYAVPIGYSDHATDPLSGAVAVGAGASLLERHLTHDRSAQGPDHAASSDPQEFVEYVRLTRKAQVLRGQGGKRLLDCELDVRGVSRQSLVLRHAKRQGETIAVEDLMTQRPADGLPPSRYQSIVGRRVACDLAAGTMLQESMLSASI